MPTSRPSPLNFSTGRMYVVGLDQFMRRLSNLYTDVDVVSRDVLSRVGAHLEGKLKERLSRTGRGRVYIRSGVSKRGRARYGTHRASAPGEPPAPDTGRLRASITFTVDKAIRKRYSYQGGSGETYLPDPGTGLFGTLWGYVGTNVNYGYYLERGTRRILPRPWFYVTIAAEQGRVTRLIMSSLQEFIRRGGR